MAFPNGGMQNWGFVFTVLSYRQAGKSVIVAGHKVNEMWVNRTEPNRTKDYNQTEPNLTEPNLRGDIALVSRKKE